MMLSPTLSPSQSSDGVFGPLSSILAESKNTLRRMKLYTALSSFGAMKCDEQSRLIAIWNDAHTQLTTSNFREILQNSIEEIAKIKGDFIEVYSEIPSMRSFETAKLLLKRYLRDRHYLADKMVVHSAAGDRGTLIISYPPPETRKDYVIKWVNQHEIHSTKLYQIFSRLFPNAFLVPDFVDIDLEQNRIALLNGESTPISESSICKLKMIYQELLHLTPQSDQTIEPMDETSKNTHLMLSKKVQGEGLFDFINSKYAEMESGQKKILFSKIGSLVAIDRNRSRGINEKGFCLLLRRRQKPFSFIPHDAVDGQS